MQRITLRAVIISIVLTIVLAASNTYLALKVGFLTSASIPAAILSMAILRFFKNSTIHENNLIQTAASAGEAVAGGIAFTAPALIIIHYWAHFDYLQTFIIAFISGILGVLFSIPLRRLLVTAKDLPFPEGKAIAEILQTVKHEKQNIREMLYGTVVGAVLDFAQSGLKMIGSGFKFWFVKQQTLFGFAGGFSIPLIGAGFLMGFRSGLSILLGALVVWGIGVPIMSMFDTATLDPHHVDQALIIYSDKIHFIGLGAMLTAGLWTLILLLKPTYQGIVSSLVNYDRNKQKSFSPLDLDLPLRFIFLGTLIMAIGLFYLLSHTFANQFSISIISLIYILLIAFIMCVICSYFSGLVGVSASPGSSVIIISVIFAALLLRNLTAVHSLTPEQLNHMMSIVVLIGCVVTGAACIANDNSQDLKVGHLIGAVPWQQQVMLMLGVLIAALVIPPIMNLLFDTYGIGDVLPHTGMDPTQTLSVPPAAMMASIAQSAFKHHIPWHLLSIGGLIISSFIVIDLWLKRLGYRLSILSIAIGIYLPLASSIPMCIGAFISLYMHKLLSSQAETNEITEYQIDVKRYKGTLLACGLVTGASIMDVIVAFLTGLTHSLESLNNAIPKTLLQLPELSGVLSILGIAFLFYLTVKRKLA